MEISEELSWYERELSRTRQALDVSGRRYRLLYDATPVALHSIDIHGRLIHVSDIWLETLGFGRDEVIGRLWVDFLAPSSRIYANEIVIPELFRTGRCKNIEYQMVRKDGVLIDILLSSVIEHDANGSPLRSLTVIEDVTERRRVQAELAAQFERLRVTLHSIADGVITTDAQGRVEYLNAVAERLTGWHNAEVHGKTSSEVFFVVDESSRQPVRSLVEMCLAEDRVVRVTDPTLMIGRDGKEYSIEELAAPIKNAAGQTLGVVLVFRDVSDQRRLSQEMTYRATHDTLTGLLNRDEFERSLQASLALVHRDDVECALMYIDLDQFKLVNDVGGHATGDKLLKQIVAIIRKCIGDDAIFARLGGDEFGLIIERCSFEHAQNVAQTICEEIDEFRFQYGNQRLRVGASIGMVSVDKRWPTATNILRAADSACYAAKQAGRNRVHTYFANDEIIESHREDMQWIRRLEQALDKGQFVLYWQKICALSDKVDGVHGEVLLRLLQDDGSLIPPGTFLPAAERFHMASRIDRWVVRAVFEWMAEHKAALAHVATLSINLSGLSVSDRDFHRYVLNLIETVPCEHHKICFEITETAAITNLNDATLFMQSMRQFGVRFALDDFGSGASSFGYLKHLPVDYLKIDGQFIRDLESDLVDQATVRCIREVAAVTGKKTIAEFVETPGVERCLREIGIDFAQGYLNHRPEAIAGIFDASPC